MRKGILPAMASLLPALCLCLSTAFGGQPDPISKNDPAYGCLKDVPVYMQEWHVWWGFPYPDPSRPQEHMSSTMTSFLQPWRLDWDRNGYPYIGLYDSENLEVVRWQLRCMKACGISSPAVMIHPAVKGGELFIQETNGFISKLLDVAAEEKYPVFFMDEVAFMQHESRDPDVMTRRVIRFLKSYGSHPGFLKIDGKPVYYYQTFGFWLGKERTEKMMADVEKETGPVHWMIFGPVQELAELPALSSIVCGASSHFQSSETRKWDWSKKDQATKPIVDLAHKYGKKATNLNYMKYENTSQPNRTPGIGLYGHQGQRLKDVVMDSMAAKSDFIMLSSWNDYEEGTYMEPSWDFDGYSGDPFFYCRLMAGLKGIEFVPPPPPPKDSVHPSVWEKLGYGDGAGPIIDSTRRTHQRGGSIEVVARDTVNPVDGLEVVWNGDYYWTAPQPYQDKPSGNLSLVSGKLAPPETLTSPIHVRIQIGAACKALSESLRFEASSFAPISAGERPALGAVYAFDPVNPTDGFVASVPVAVKYRLRQEPGKLDGFAKMRLAPHNKPEDVGAYALEGWQSRVAVAPTKVAFDDACKGVSLDSASGKAIAHFSILGDPDPKRVIATDPAQTENGGKLARFYVEIPISILETPGVSFVWVRARDAAGNWGSPKLIPISNYEYPDPSKEPPAVDASWRKDNGAAFACRFETGETKWNGVWPAKAGIFLALKKSVVSNHVGEVSNELLRADFAAPVEGSFELSFKMLHMNARRSSTLWIADASGSKAYGVCWTYGAPGEFNDEGCVSVLKVDKDSEIQWDEKAATRLCNPVASGHKALAMPLAEFKLLRDSSKGEIKLYVDGVERLSVADSSFNSFSRIYLRGNSNALFDDIIVKKLNARDAGK